ncbi:hypothetical protein FHG87_018868 [Trinorchestia longiramus]|nr:hypothetical protein FHG87_018868 [Trinorchestia longiramus]
MDGRAKSDMDDRAKSDMDDRAKSLFDEVLAEIATTHAGAEGTSPAVPGPAPTSSAQEGPVQDPEVSPGLLQGDIAVATTTDEIILRHSINFDVFPERRWPNGTVPYTVSPLYCECVPSVLCPLCTVSASPLYCVPSVL